MCVWRYNQMIIITEIEQISRGVFKNTISRSSQIAIETEYDIRLLIDLKQANILPCHGVQSRTEIKETAARKLLDYFFCG